MSVFTKPSFYALIITGILSLVVLVKGLRLKTGPKASIHIISIVGILIGVHGLLHLGMEHVYNYNPIELFLDKYQ